MMDIIRTLCAIFFLTNTAVAAAVLFTMEPTGALRGWARGSIEGFAAGLVLNIMWIDLW